MASRTKAVRWKVVSEGRGRGAIGGIFGRNRRGTRSGEADEWHRRESPCDAMRASEQTARPYGRLVTINRNLIGIVCDQFHAGRCTNIADVDWHIWMSGNDLFDRIYGRARCDFSSFDSFFFLSVLHSNYSRLNGCRETFKWIFVGQMSWTRIGWAAEFEMSFNRGRDDLWGSRWLRPSLWGFWTA